MKKHLSLLALLGSVAALALLSAVIAGCQNSGGDTSGKIQSNLGPAEQDPAKFKKGVEDLLAKEKAGKK